MKKLFSIFLSVLTLALIPCLGAGIAYAEQDRYALDFVQGGSYTYTQYRDVYYSTKNDNNRYENPNKAPDFLATLSNACAVTAGGNALVYYDIKYNDLVPDYERIYFFGKYSYGSQTDAIDNMFSTLYSMMGTDSRGTTVEGFKSGMQQYVSSRGHNISFTKVAGNYHGVDLSALKLALQSEKMATVFMDTFTLTTFDEIVQNDGHDRITHYMFYGQHVMLVYGYRDIIYYNADGSVKQQDTYLMVSTGYSSATLAYLDITHYCNVDDIYILDVT